MKPYAGMTLADIVHDALVMLHAYETDNRPPAATLHRLQELRKTSPKACSKCGGEHESMYCEPVRVT